MSELVEDRLQRELAQRADEVSGWSVPGAALRGTAQARASKRRQRATVLAGTVAVASVLAATTWLGGGPGDAAPPADPSPTDTRPDNPALRVHVPAHVVGSVRNRLGAGDAVLEATAKLPASGRTAMVFVDEPPVPEPGRGMTAMAVTLDGEDPVLGSLAHYDQPSDVIAQPVRDGGRTVLLVLVPETLGGEVVEVLVGRPGRVPVVESGPVIGRVALVPLPGPDLVTELRVLRGGLDVHVGIPGGSLLGPDAPQRLDRIAASVPAESPTGWSAQLRTDGSTACWLTAFGFEPGDAFVTGWNLTSNGCAPVGVGLRLLLPDDRGDGSVAGLASDGAEQVRLHWRDGTTTTLPVVGDGTVRGFAGPDGRRADQLTRVDALAVDGRVIASQRP